MRRPADAASPRSVRIDGVIGIHPALDLALLRVTDAANGMAKPLAVMSQDPGPLEGRNLYVLGYPAPDYRNDACGPALDLRGPVLRQAPSAGSGDGASGRRDHPARSPAQAAPSRMT